MAMTRVGTAFVPVQNSASAAEWYAERLGMTVSSIERHAAVLEAPGGGRVTLLSVDSGVAVAPGLPWATCNYVVEDLDAAHARAVDDLLDPSPIEGDPRVCRFFTMRDPDGNVVLCVDR